MILALSLKKVDDIYAVDPGLEAVYAFHVHIEVTKENNVGVCSGVFYSNKLVVTAYSCVAKYNTVV
jgi:hypothetical protein